MIILIARDVFVKPIPQPIIPFIIAVGILWMEYKDGVLLTFFILPFTVGIPGYSITFALLALIIKRRSLNLNAMWSAFILLIIEIVDFFVVGLDVDIQRLLSYCSFMLLFFFLILEVSKDIDAGSCILYYSFGLIFTLAVIYFNMASQNGFDRLIAGELRNGIQGLLDNEESSIGHLVINANSTAYMCLASASSLLCGRKYIKISPMLINILIGIVFLIGMMSFSRTYILSLVLLVLLLLIFRRQKVRVIVHIALLVFAAIIFFPYIFDNFINGMTARLGESNLSTAGGRTIIFKEYLELWGSNTYYMFFGTGASDYMQILHTSRALHCGLEQVLVCCGLIGLMVWGISIFKFILKNKSELSIEDFKIFIIPLIVTVLFDQSIQFLNPYYLMLPIIPALYTLRLRPNYV